MFCYFKTLENKTFGATPKCSDAQEFHCTFCDNLVCTKEEFEKIRSGSRKGENLKEELMKKTWNPIDLISENLKSLQVSKSTNGEPVNEAMLQKAIDHKNKLIDYDRSRFLK